MDIATQFPALADATRRAIFEAVAQRPRSVAELADESPVSRPAVSQHLRVLQDAGLVRHERQGTRNLYEVDAAGLASLRAYLDGMWTRALDNFKTVAESTYKPSRPKPKHRSRR
jgi:DNA-binding transcriptional ArsR family regulator